MKLAIRTILFQMICIIIFGIVYYYLEDHFIDLQGNVKKYSTILDYILLSTTVQASVGITDLLPNTFYSKLTILIQQLIMISTNIFTLYIFTI
jgi:hypothetical protein